MQVEDEDFPTSEGANVGSGTEALPLVLILDTSHSMSKRDPVSGKVPIEELNQALPALPQHIANDPQAFAYTYVMIITIGGGVQVGEFVPIRDFAPRTYQASGGTALCGGVLAAIDATERFLTEVKAKPGRALKPCIVLITDGQPTDAGKDGAQLQQAIRRAQRVVNDNTWAFVTAGAPGADMGLLKSMSANPDHCLELASGVAWDELIEVTSEIAIAVYNSDQDAHADISETVQESGQLKISDALVSSHGYV